jgi:hypothetical protein
MTDIEYLVAHLPDDLNVDTKADVILAQLPLS